MKQIAVTTSNEIPDKQVSFEPAYDIITCGAICRPEEKSCSLPLNYRMRPDDVATVTRAAASQASVPVGTSRSIANTEVKLTANWPLRCSKGPAPVCLGRLERELVPVESAVSLGF